MIARLEPVEEFSQNPEIVILSAHQDSVNMWNPWFGRSPGADDDGSGTTTVFEAMTVLVEGGYVPSSRILEFHFYAAEEGGLLGSQKVVEQYVSQSNRFPFNARSSCLCRAAQRYDWIPTRWIEACRSN